MSGREVVTRSCAQKAAEEDAKRVAEEYKQAVENAKRMVEAAKRAMERTAWQATHAATITFDSITRRNTAYATYTDLYAAADAESRSVDEPSVRRPRGSGRVTRRPQILSSGEEEVDDADEGE
jgi:membrane protein involved in colicin uptake